MSAVERWDVIIIGGGAAGLMCAAVAGRRGRRVLLVEHQDRLGKKILISGGGRCNFTNLGATWQNYQSEQPNFAKSALARYTPWDFVGLVEKHGIRYHEKKLGQQFCDGSSKEIVELLVQECAEAGVSLRPSGRVESVAKSTDGFRLQARPASAAAAGAEWAATPELECQALVIATGALSFPKLGATDFGHRLAKQFGLRVTPLRPGLVPLTLAGAELEDALELTGAAVDVVATAGGQTFPEAVLFTHRGVSGPAVLQVSSYWREGEPVTARLLPPAVHAARLWQQGRAGRARLEQILAPYFPARFAERWAARYTPPKPIPQWTRAEEDRATAALERWTLHPTGTEGYAKAEVTVGGVDTAALSSKTMEARAVPGLYFIGEVVDVTGWLGGYNFQWAWASGTAAGQAA